MKLRSNFSFHRTSPYTENFGLSVELNFYFERVSVLWVFNGIQGEIVIESAWFFSAVSLNLQQ
jgi:hypothetical protein